MDMFLMRLPVSCFEQPSSYLIKANYIYDQNKINNTRKTRKKINKQNKDKKCPLLAVRTVRMKEEGKKINEDSSQCSEVDDASCSVQKSRTTQRRLRSTTTNCKESESSQGPTKRNNVAEMELGCTC